MNIADDKGWTCLFTAIESTETGLPEIVELLLKNGLNINHQDHKGISALHLSAYKGQDDNVDLLIKYKADIDLKDIFGRTPIFFAIMEGQTNAIQALLDAGCDYNIKDNNGDSVMHYSYYTKGNNLLYTIMLHEKGMDIDVIDNNENTILILAGKDGVKKNLRLIKKLIEFSANPNKKNSKGLTFNDIAYSEAVTNKEFSKVLLKPQSNKTKG